METAAFPARPGPVLSSIVSALVVVAHPDDESFGLGAVLAALADGDVPVTVLCYTHGEASTLRDRPGDLGAVRAHELRQAGKVLGVDRVELLDHPDGGLHTVELATLTAPVTALIAETHPSHLLVFDTNGVTGHPDHVRATEAALAAADLADLPVVAWALPRHVADRLNAEFGTAFAGHDPDGLDESLAVSRARQREAIACHASQATDNPVLHRRIALLGDAEHLRMVRTAGSRSD